MRRFPHYLRGNKSVELPHLLAYVDTETEDDRSDPSRQRHHLTFGWVCFERSYGDDKWIEPQWSRFETPDEFWTIIESYLRPRTKLYLFAHNWAFDGPVLKMFHLLPPRGWELTRAIIESPPVILRWSGERRTILCLDTLNWFKFPLAKLGKRVGIEKLTMPEKGASDEDWDTYCKADVQILQKTVRGWMAFIRTHDLGGFAPTLASQSFRAYRHRFMRHEIFFDDNEPALEISRDSFHGGRTEAFFIGKVDTPIYCYDVNSMYPAVMAENEYPIKLVSRTTHGTVADIGKWLKYYSVVARVRIEASEPRYAYWTGKKLVFPIGRFTTSLTSPDLRSALRSGELKACLDVAVYEKGTIFTDFVRELYALRMEAKKGGDKEATYFLKIFMNSLYGKFAQKGRVWETIGKATLDEWGVEFIIDRDAKTMRHIRRYAGIMQEKMRDEEGRESFPAIASHVTAYARAHLWRLISLAGLDNTYYCDTDSLYVNEAGSKRLQPEIGEDILGALKLEKVVSHGSIYGAKDYQFGEEWKCKGVRRKAEWKSPNVVVQEEWPKLQGLLLRDSIDAPLILKKEKHLSRQYDKGVIHPDGRVTPLSFNDW